jgi:hypothetical protein
VDVKTPAPRIVRGFFLLTQLLNLGNLSFSLVIQSTSYLDLSFFWELLRTLLKQICVPGSDNLLFL